ncbi:hypothetical protein HCC61_04275 [Streptomyces sp. HNM0575]|uniref:hypothetical protein n=1 Tax=Streptomyces sp. HNM0575 TaxID=2716338 RepID=UPI00145D66A2|nr:hypothetical protein [Streptomyces sp. HNM0575]NLU71907.1 hypothetical protein [Streptomyces sp. HNM0575]
MNEESRSIQEYMDADREGMTRAACDFLDKWLSEMQDELRTWRSTYLPSDFPFDFSLNSLDILEGVALERYGDPADVETSGNAEFTNGAVRYIGETVVRNFPSRWGYQDLGDDSPGIYNKIPVVRANVPHEFLDGFAPVFELRLLAEERQAGMLKECPAPIVNAIEECEEATGGKSNG